MIVLEDIKWQPKWVSHLGCLKGCLDYLNVEVSDAWLYGASGHAFVINIHEELCPSAPTAWNTERMTELCENVGCDIQTIFAHKSQMDFAEKQALAWTEVRSAIDDKQPCYGWELEIPEFYVIHGYDDVGYYFSGPSCDDGKSPKAWQKLGDSEIGMLEVYIVRRAESKNVERIVKDAFQFALDHARDSEQWTFPKYSTGLAGYDSWINALRENKADAFGTAYNAAVWAECRGHAVDFLKEAKGKLDNDLSPLFDDAITQYTIVSENLIKVSETFPFANISDEQKVENMQDETRRTTAIQALQSARDAEEKGLAILQQIAESL